MAVDSHSAFGLCPHSCLLSSLLHLCHSALCNLYSAFCILPSSYHMTIPWLVRGTVPLSEPPAPTPAETHWAAPGEAVTPSPAPVLSATPVPAAAPGGSAARAQARCVRGSQTRTQPGADPPAHPPAPPLAQTTAAPLSPAGKTTPETIQTTRLARKHLITADSASVPHSETHQTTVYLVNWTTNRVIPSSPRLNIGIGAKPRDSDLTSCRLQATIALTPA